MNRAYRNRMLAAFDGYARKLGMPLPEALKRLQQFARREKHFWETHGDMRSFEAALIKAPNPTEKEMAAAEAFLDLLPWLTRAVVETHLPPDPGGRSFDLNEEQCEKAIGDIKRMSKTMPLEKAVNETARNFQIHPKTMWKIWLGGTETREFQEGELKRKARQMIADGPQPPQDEKKGSQSST